MNSKALVVVATISLGSFGLSCRAGERESELAIVAALEALSKIVLDLPRAESGARGATFDPRAGFGGLSREELRQRLSAAGERARDRAWFSLREQSDETIVKIGISTTGASFWHSIVYHIGSDHVDSVSYSLHFVDAALPKEPNQPPQHNAGSRPPSMESPASETLSSLGPRG